VRKAAGAAEPAEEEADDVVVGMHVDVALADADAVTTVAAVAAMERAPARRRAVGAVELEDRVPGDPGVFLDVGEHHTLAAAAVAAPPSGGHAGRSEGPEGPDDPADAVGLQGDVAIGRIVAEAFHHDAGRTAARPAVTARPGQAQPADRADRAV